MNITVTTASNIPRGTLRGYASVVYMNPFDYLLYQNLLAQEERKRKIKESIEVWK